MLFEFSVHCDLKAVEVTPPFLVGMLFAFRVDCDSCCFFSCCFFDVGMLFEFRVDCDFQVRQLQTITFLWECYLNLEWIATLWRFVKAASPAVGMLFEFRVDCDLEN